MLACRKIKEIIAGLSYPVKFRIEKSSRSLFRLLLLSKIFIVHILNIINNRLRFHKIIRIGLKTAIFSTLIFLIAIGFEPLKIFASISNLYNDTGVINLYAGSCQTEAMSDNYESGWWNAQNAAGQPELGPDGKLLVFSDANSAFYAGGVFNLICQNFSAPTAPVEKNASPIEEAVKNEPDNKESNETISENTANSLDSPASSSEDKIKADEEAETADNFEKSGPITIENNLPEENVEITDATDEQAAVEIINKDEEKTTVEFLDENLFTNTLNYIKDSISRVTDYFKVHMPNLTARATDEKFATTAGDILELGEFKSAKIKLSLAMGSVNGAGQTETVNNTASDQGVLTIDGHNQNPADDSRSESVSGSQNYLESDGFLNSGPDVQIYEENKNSEINIIDDQSANEPAVVSPAEPAADNSQNAEIVNPSGHENEPESAAGADDTGSETDNQPVSYFKNALEFLLADKASAQSGDGIAEDNRQIIIWYTLDDYSVPTTSKELPALDDRAIVNSSNELNTASGSGSILWQKLDTIYAADISNGQNGGYLSLEAGFLKSWADVKNLKIKFEGVADAKTEFTSYLDSVWVEAEFKAKEDESVKMARWKKMLSLISDKTVFSYNEILTLKFHYDKKDDSLKNLLGEALNIVDYWNEVDFKVRLIDGQGQELTSPLSLVFENNGDITIKSDKLPRQFRPGKYQLAFTINDKSDGSEETIELSHDFIWGVVAFNTNKSIYTPEETAFLQMALLDNNGNTICSGDLSLEIEMPGGSKNVLSTRTGGITVNQQCGVNNIMYTPDYYADFYLKEAGIYKVKLIARTAEGEREIEDKFEVRDSVPFDIERAGPTRIYPKADYQMMIGIKANEDFSGELKEFVPTGFKIVKQSVKIKKVGDATFTKIILPFKTTISNDELGLTWTDFNVEEGDEIKINYVFDAPDISPEFYLLGPVRLLQGFGGQASPDQDLNGQEVIFEEARNWQIASDAVNSRSKTVRFYGGRYMGTGAAGQTSNTNYTLSAFNFNLAETGVTIKNAFLLFEARYESYADTAGSSTGYTLAFDACTNATCTPSAFTGTSTISKVDSTNLSGPETESNQLRLLLDVTNELEMASYSGDGRVLRGQIGYSINRAAALANFISYTQATLVITYTYDPYNSESYTNTVVYPLESLDSNRRGTKATSTIDDCALNSTCPLFDYKLDIPDFASTTGSVQQSSWFQMFESAYGNGVRDITASVNIQGPDSPSASFINESANSDQGTQPIMFFTLTGAQGHYENATRTLEYRATTPTSNPPHRLIGGEVVDTYTASTSAPVKTKTVSFSIGTVNNGNTTATTSTSTNIYFPENGTGSGTVTIKKAWLRIISNGYSAAIATTSITTRVGTGATSTTLGYNFYPAATTIQQAFYIYHIIPASDYPEMQSANAITPKTFTMATKNSAVNQGGLSAELMITYTYTNDKAGYLVSNELFAGQQAVTSRTLSTTTATANFVAPEASKKTIRGGALRPFYLISDSDGVMSTINTLLGTNISTGDPTCVNSYISRPNGVNGATEFYKDIRSALLTTDNQSYNACYSNNAAGGVTGGAKMNGTLTYTYQWDDTAPTSTFNFVNHKRDGTGAVAINFKANDIDGDNLTLKLEYAAGSACDFTSPLDPVLATTSISADNGTPAIDNAQTFQIGTSTGWVVTNSGENNVSLDWLSSTNLPNAEGQYCLRLTATDLGYEQSLPATSTLAIDNKLPTIPGPLTSNSRTNNSIILNLGATSTETNFKEYKIFYKIADDTPVTESDSVFSSSSDINLGNILYNNKSTTTVSGLLTSTVYSFSIWAYDQYGNRASSSKVDITTTGPPQGYINSVIQKTDGSGIADIEIVVDDPNNGDNIRVKSEYVLGEDCNFASPNKTLLDDNPANISSTHTKPVIDNSYAYQIGTTSGWILTSPGANTINFDWLAFSDLGAGIDATYCIRITANNQLADQTLPATTTINIDTLNPSRPGNLSKHFSGNDHIDLNFGSETTENHFKEYKIFYKEGTMGVTEADSVLSSSTDPNLGDRLFNDESTTTIGGLLPDTYYVFNIWAYDQFGNKASALNEVFIKTNGPPTGTINSAEQKKDGSGEVEIFMDIDDVDSDDARAKIEYVAGLDCDFASPLDPTLDPASISAIIGTPVIDDLYPYQIGTTTGWISTLFANTVNFNWLSKSDELTADGDYCLRLTVNDMQADQAILSTTTFTLDNTAPLQPTNLTTASTTKNSITLNLGAPSSDTHFKEYKIFYKQGESGVTENDSLFGSSSDPNLGFEDFQTAGTVTISGLEANSMYVFNIWAYDSYGNKASATEVVQLVTTDDNKRSRTVKFFGGQYMGTGAAGQRSDMDYSLPTFNFNLVESAVSIKNAFILFEGQYEAYGNNVGTSTGYTLAFDACSGAACTPDALSGTGNVVKVDSTALSGGETESNQLRLLLDVTRETQLASYAGSGNILRGAVGYRINQNAGPVVNFISHAQATLVVTYNYDPVGSESYTNTVIYPLKSIDSSGQGTKSTSTVNNCVLNSACPLFDYNMDIPEYDPGSGSSNLSQWFQMYMETNNNLTNDIRTAVNIQGTDIGSNVYVHEAANSDQGNLSAMVFASVSGYLENTAQTLEYQASTTAGTPVHYLIGGETYETYTASTSAPVKTRTVSFPIGVLNNGNTTATTSTSTYFYFPENGLTNGTVQVKEAWLRIISSNYINTAGYNTSVTTKIGDQATSTTKVYNYLQPATVVAPNFYIFHVFSATDNDELELANAVNSKKITIAMKNSTANQNGTSIELMVTYSYTDEYKGYLVNNTLFGGQQATDGIARSTTTQTANFVAPELTGKTIRAGALQAFYLMSSASGAMGNAIYTVDARISTGNPTCVNAYNMRPDSNNSSSEFYRDIKGLLLTDNNQAYNACYSNNGGNLSPQGAKMNGTLIYTYQWDNTAPTSTFNSAVSRTDGSGIVDISIKANDINNNNLRVKIDYATGTDCIFSESGDPTLDDNQGNISADYGDPVIDNNYAYQVGTTSGWITTVVGENNVNFDWLSVNNLDDQESDYCLRITASDQGYDQTVPATTTLTIDNKAPTVAGPLSINRRGNDNITLNLNSTSTETHFKEYKIFYKVFDDTPVTESDSVFASTSEPDGILGNILFKDRSTTTISGLLASTTYSFNIWAYDNYGNKSSSTQVNIATNGAPTGTITSAAQKTDGSGTVDISINADDPNDDDTLSAKIEYVLGAGCDFGTPNKATIDANVINIQSDHGTVTVDNFSDYQVGPAFGWIVTSPGENNVSFDWFALTDLNEGVDATYCIRTTLNDGLIDQAIPPTQTLTVDTLDPTRPGDLTANYVDVNSIIINFGDETTENHFKEYKIFYKPGMSGVTEEDAVLASSSDVHLGDKFFNGFATTTIGGLMQDTDYVFNIWAYDEYGNKASATNEFTAKTKDMPTAAFISAQQKADGSGGIDIAMTVRENQGSDSRVKIQYVAGEDCNFASPNYPSLDVTDENITATYGDPDIDNNYPYQVGTTTGWIITASGINTVNFDWYSKLDIPLADGAYCLRAIANNQLIDQIYPATTTLNIDNTDPLTPGNLSVVETKSNSVILSFGDETFDTNFKEYKIFYKEGTEAVTEADLVHSSSTDINLGADDYGEVATTTITGLKINTQYVFNIWAYDNFGNRASATIEATTTTDFTPKAQNWRWYYDYYNHSVSLPVSLENTSPNTITDNNSLKLRLAINETAGKAGENIKFRLQYSTFADFSSDVHFVGEIGSSSPWNYVDGGGDDNGIITGLVLSDTTREGTFNEIGSSTNVYEHLPNTAVEYDFAIRNNGAEKSQVYYFRAYDNFNGLPVTLNTGETYPSLSTSDSSISYTIDGLEAGTTTEGVTTDIVSAAGLLDFGHMAVNTDKIGAHRFTVDTNAGNGYQLLAYERQPLSNSFGFQFQPVAGTNDAPDIWPAAPDPSAYGYHTSDDTLSGISPSRFLPDNTYSRFETDFREVGYSPIPVQNETIDLVYRLEASVLQSAGTYETEVVYIVVPNF